MLHQAIRQCLEQPQAVEHRVSISLRDLLLIPCSVDYDHFPVILSGDKLPTSLPHRINATPYWFPSTDRAHAVMANANHNRETI